MVVDHRHIARAHVIADAGHLNCITKPDFKTQLEAALQLSSP
jgi:hypothetical protein